MRCSYVKMLAGLLLALTLACTGDDHGTSDSATTSSSITSTSSGSTTGASTGSATGSTAGSTADSTSANTTANTNTNTNTTANTTPDTTDSESSTSTTGTSSSSTGDPTSTSTGGGDVVCEDLGAADFGDCATPLGWIFDGNSCVSLSGCDCGPHCDAIFSSASECSGTCAASGECKSELLIGKGIAKGPYGVGNFCDEVTICGGPSMAVTELLADALCMDMAEYPCEGGPGCTLFDVDTITQEQLEKLCAASLLPGVDLVACVVWGP